MDNIIYNIYFLYGFIEFIKNYIRHEDGSEYLGGTIAQICTNKSGCAHLVRRPYDSNMQFYSIGFPLGLKPFPGPVLCKYCGSRICGLT